MSARASNFIQLTFNTFVLDKLEKVYFLGITWKKKKNHSILCTGLLSKYNTDNRDCLGKPDFQQMVGCGEIQMEKTTTAEGQYSLLYNLPQAVFNYLFARGTISLRDAAREEFDLESLCL